MIWGRRAVGQDLKTEVDKPVQGLTTRSDMLGLDLTLVLDIADLMLVSDKGHQVLMLTYLGEFHSESTQDFQVVQSGKPGLCFGAPFGMLLGQD